MPAASLSRRGFLAAAAGAAAWAAGSAPRRRPNLVFILADDLGWRDTSVYGSTFLRTPHIDRLAARGMRFTQAYAANPLCSPTRASILTGLWPARIGITAPACHLPEEKLEPTVIPAAPADQPYRQTISATRLKQEYRTLAETLREAGYRTAHFGKWHLGPEPYDPLHQGFEVDIPHTPGPGPGGGYFAPYRFARGLEAPAGEHIEDRLSTEATAWMRAHRDEPFYLNYWSFSVHSPWVVDGVPQGKPDWMEEYARRADPASPQRNPLYGAMVQALDNAVGRLLDGLDELGLADYTIVVFTSDNGGVHFHDEPAGTPITSNAPLRGGKATIYEGGTREAAIVAWPGRIAAGAVNDTIIQSIDYHPTLLELLEVAPPAGAAFDGVSLKPVLTGTGGLDREAIYCFFPHATPATGAVPSAYVRQGDWKLIRNFHANADGSHGYELYNLADDLGETTNLAAAQPDRVRALDAKIDGWLADCRAVLPQRNPAYNPLVASYGLSGSRDVVLSLDGDDLVVEATGGDPWIASRGELSAPGPLTLSLRMRSAADGPGQVYWAEQGVTPQYAAARSVPLAAIHDDAWHEYTVELPSQGTITAVRLDPANAPGRLRIAWIRLADAAGRLVREWTFAPR